MFADNTIQQQIRDVFGIKKHKKKCIKSFLQGAVYCWCACKGTEWFSLRNLAGGVNYQWNGNPLFHLYKKHRKLGKNDDESIRAAGKDAGWLLKMVISEDNRTFETKTEGLIRMYRWDGSTANDSTDIYNL